MAPNYRVGFGYDLHKFVDVKGDFCIKLCGVNVKHDYRVEANSDGDVAIHSLIDALLGAAALGDIGEHFPVNDTWKNADSRELLKTVVSLVSETGYKIGNIDLSIVCEKPVLLPYKDAMRHSIAELLQIEKFYVGVKAKTNEKIGCIGRKEGIATFAVATLYI